MKQRRTMSPVECDVKWERKMCLWLVCDKPLFSSRWCTLFQQFKTMYFYVVLLIKRLNNYIINLSYLIFFVQLAFITTNFFKSFSKIRRQHLKRKVFFLPYTTKNRELYFNSKLRTNIRYIIIFIYFYKVKFSFQRTIYLTLLSKTTH